MNLIGSDSNAETHFMHVKKIAMVIVIVQCNDYNGVPNLSSVNFNKESINSNQ